MTTAIQRLEICISDVSHWMVAKRLKLNADKTELLWAGSKYVSASLVGSRPPLRLGDKTITASDYVRPLGVTISSDLRTDKHVSNTSSSCFYWLHQIRRIRRRLTPRLQRHWCMPSSHLGLTATTPCWPGRPRPPLIVFSVCPMQLLGLSVEPTSSTAARHICFTPSSTG